ncbi:MAG: large repetitive protein, partial [Chloroflexota bacterium]|nr:large repetitive protein [Chloroflexota bacterium]
MRLTRRPEAPDTSDGQVERLREAVAILHRVMGITDRAFREAVADGYIVLPPPLRERVATTVSPAVHADYQARVAELSAQAARLREWAARLPEAGVVVPEPQELDPVRLLAWSRRSGPEAAGEASASVPGPAAAAAPPPAAVAAAADPPPPRASRVAAVVRALRHSRPLLAAGALMAVAAVAGTGMAVLRPPSSAAPARDTRVTAGPVRTPGVIPARSGEAVAAGPGSQAAVLFGGVSPGGGLLDDTWVFDGRSWSEVHPGAAPPARAGALVAYDAARHVVLLTGGRGATGALTDTWSWDGVGWTAQLPETPPRLGPWSGMAADGAARTVVLVTGRSGVPAQTWLWDGRNWSRAQPAAEPVLSGPPVMSTDPQGGHPLLVTAAGPGASPASTWSWDGSTWSLHTQGSPVVVRPGATWMAADPTA